MTSTAVKFSTDPTPRDAFDILEQTHAEELVIALCGQLGTDIKKIQEILIEELESKYKYECKVIPLSKFIFNHSSYTYSSSDSEYERIKKGMEGGNELRNAHGKQILAEFAIREIIDNKMSYNSPSDIENEKFKTKRICYIINSVKHPDEIKLFNEVYRNIFYTIGIFSPIDLRLQRLGKKIEGSGVNIHELINRDTGEDISHGQKVEDAFVDSDYFIRVSTNEKSKLKPKVERFLDLVFDIGILTPDKSETAMYQATAAAANSSCLSRQVGACITDNKGDILSLGWNDVPKHGGNLYPDIEADRDERCFNTGDCECANVRKKTEIKGNILESLKKLNILKEGNHDEKILEILDTNGIKGLIEFARSIHAEMHAIIIGSQKSGNKMVGGKLFCTTYPCHNCARHIIVAGISEVYYIEPYKKSLCIDLHSDAITEDEYIPDRVKIIMYEGVAPRKYMDFYKLVSDNRKAKMQYQDRSIAKPKHTITLRALHQLESSLTKNLKDRGF
ncbi:MAG: anti-phage dCTP deaminase [Carboxylicivirga sp.]|jgi:deoxycytidylate deaminase|nr:anti-phage dCTP deaminase [Carboxylicivirga sp.]